MIIIIIVIIISRYSSCMPVSKCCDIVLSSPALHILLLPANIYFIVVIDAVFVVVAIVVLTFLRFRIVKSATCPSRYIECSYFCLAIPKELQRKNVNKRTEYFSQLPNKSKTDVDGSGTKKDRRKWERDRER